MSARTAAAFARSSPATSFRSRPVFSGIPPPDGRRVQVRRFCGSGQLDFTMSRSVRHQDEPVATGNAFDRRMPHHRAQPRDLGMQAAPERSGQRVAHIVDEAFGSPSSPASARTPTTAGRADRRSGTRSGRHRHHAVGHRLVRSGAHVRSRDGDRTQQPDHDRGGGRTSDVDTSSRVRSRATDSGWAISRSVQRFLPGRREVVDVLGCPPRGGRVVRNLSSEPAVGACVIAPGCSISDSMPPSDSAG